MAYQCEQCGASFSKLSQLKQHKRTEDHWGKYPCGVCGKVFSRAGNLERHKKKHEAENLHCTHCDQVFTRSDNLRRHQLLKHQVGSGKRRPVSDTEERPVAKRLKKVDDPRQFYTVSKLKEQHMKKFRTTASTYKVNFKDLEVTEDVHATLKLLFTAIFSDLTRGTKSEDLVRLTVQSPSLDYPIVIPFLRITELTADRFMSEIERVLQSNEDFTESLIFEVTLVDMPVGGTRKRCRYVNTEKFLLDKRCIIQIQNQDDLCCARAIVTAKAKLDNHEKWNSIRLGKALQEELAKRLHEQASIPLGKCGLAEIKKIQEVLPDYQISLVSKEYFNGITYSGPEAENKIYLYHHDDHYDVITSMSAFLSRNYFCTQCTKGYDHKEQHACNSVCHNCRKVHDVCDEPWIECEECNRFFRGEQCYDLHKSMTAQGNTTCKLIYRCKQCRKTVNKKLDKNHKCGQIYCAVCQDFFEEGHRCYMMPEETEHMSLEEIAIDEIENAQTFIFFDFECTQQDLIQCNRGYTPDAFGKCQNCFKSV